MSGGVAIAMIPVIWEALQLPGLGQTPITAFVIMTAMRHEPAWKAATRAFGCLLGGLYGLLAMSWVGDASLPWLVSLAAGFFVCGHIYRGSGDASYVGQQAGVAIMLAMIQGAAPSSDILPAIDRMVGVFGGILVVAACHPVLAPVVRRLIGGARRPERMRGRSPGKTHDRRIGCGRDTTDMGIRSDTDRIYLFGASRRASRFFFFLFRSGRTPPAAGCR